MSVMEQDLKDIDPIIKNKLKKGKSLVIYDSYLCSHAELKLPEGQACGGPDVRNDWPTTGLSLPRPPPPFGGALGPHNLPSPCSQFGGQPQASGRAPGLPCDNANVICGCSHFLESTISLILRSLLKGSFR
jgi:hypothetical protein